MIVKILIISQLWVLFLVVCALISNKFVSNDKILISKDIVLFFIAIVLVPPVLIYILMHIAFANRDYEFLKKLLLTIVFPPIILYFNLIENRNEIIRDIIE